MGAISDLGARALRRLEPETAHTLAMAALSAGVGPVAEADDPRLTTSLAGLSLPNPVGLAAGFDKDARAWRALLRTGFGFVECGTVTPKAQSGNPKPRLFRLDADGAVINRMGFNNRGLEPFASRITQRRGSPGVLGANIGANKDSADRIADYAAALTRLHPLADYLTVNVSSPNTPGLRALQTGEALEDLLARLAEARAMFAVRKPLFLKIAPDLDPAGVEAAVAAAAAHGLDGLIVGNTTLSRPASLESPQRTEAGGLSGAPLRDLADSVLRRAARTARSDAASRSLVFIAAGGIASGAEAYARLRAGATAVQVYTAFVLEGPSLVGRIKRELLQLLLADGLPGPAAAVGLDLDGAA